MTVSDRDRTARSRLVGVGMVKNEADVVETSIRHNLRFLDEMIVLDHDSTDATPTILSSLVDEGLPLKLTRLSKATASFKQSECITFLANAAFARHGADIVFPIDADEYIRCESRAVLDDDIADCADDVMHLRWQTYVDNDSGETDILRRMRWRVETRRQAPPKIALRRPKQVPGNWKIGPGNHLLYTQENAKTEWTNGTKLPNVTLAHTPVRSREQLIAKALIGWLSNRLAIGKEEAESTRFGWHWRELFRRIVAGDDITSKDLLMYTVNAYAMDRVYQAGDEDLFTLVEELIATSVELRYTTHVPIDPLRALANWTSLLIDELQRQPV
jgi:hypothetical protein